jgi:hypothetical protein
MRGRWTPLLVAAIAALGVLATVDALRGADSEPEAERKRPVVTQSPAADLRRADVHGVLYLSTRRGEGCNLRAISLPNLQDFASFEGESCRFDVSEQGDIVTGGACPGRRVEVRPVDAVSSTLVGCAPAWRPDRTLTFVRDGDVMTPKEVLIKDVARFAENALGQSSGLVVRQLAWLSDTRVVVLVSAGAPGPGVVIVIEGDRLVSEPIFVGSRSTINVMRYTEELVVDGQVFDTHGRFVSGSRVPFGDVAAVADSPGGRWFALARPGSVCIYEETDPPPRERFPITCLDLDAVALAWR